MDKNTFFKKFSKSKSFGFENNLIDLTLSDEEKSKNGDNKRKNLEIFKNGLTKSSISWLNIFEPQIVEDLAIHVKKVNEVQSFLKHCDFIREKHQSNQIGLFTGPSGAGKTTCLKTLSRILGFQLIEWVTPTDVETESTSFNCFYPLKEQQLTDFKRFIFQSSRYKSLLETSSSSKRILLIEDFPHLIIQDTNLLVEILEKYKLYGKSPIVFIVTDSRSRELNLSYNLFPDNVKDKFDVAHISFNSVPMTLMKKALKRINSEITMKPYRNMYNILNEETLDSICLSANGDLRNAVINLHFSSLKCSRSVKLINFKNKLKSKKKQLLKSKKLLSIGCDETITLMHALGRVFYPKYIQNTDPKCLLHSPEELTNQFSSENKHFVNFIHANYISHFSNIENFAEAADNVSLSDILMTEYRDSNVGNLGLNIAVRALMVSNTNPTSNWASIKGPEKFKKNSYVVEYNKFNLLCNVSKNTFVTDMKSFLSKINKKSN